jgi:hypothetical protein
MIWRMIKTTVCIIRLNFQQSALADNINFGIDNSYAQPRPIQFNY